MAKKSIGLELDLMVASGVLSALVAVGAAVLWSDSLRSLSFLVFGALLPLAAGAFAALRLGDTVKGELEDLRRENRRLAHRDAHDALTGLASRTGFEAAIGDKLAACARSGRRMALLYVDMDGFKQVNDSHGHAVGDEVLRLFAARLQAGVRESDLVGRLGGDEFGVLLDDTGPAQALKVADELIDRLSRPYAVGTLRVEVSASIGVAVHPECGLSAQALIEAADAAMYRAKDGGKRRYAVSDFMPLA